MLESNYTPARTQGPSASPDAKKRLGRKGKSRRPGTLAEVADHRRKSLPHLPNRRNGAHVGKRRGRGKAPGADDRGVARDPGDLSGCPSMERPRTGMELCPHRVRKHAADCAGGCCGSRAKSAGDGRSASGEPPAETPAQAEQGDTSPAGATPLGGDGHPATEGSPEPPELDTVAHCGDSMQDRLIRMPCRRRSPRR